MFRMLAEDRKVLAACLGGSFLAYHLVIGLRDYLSRRRVEWVPVGTVTHLWLYPIKSCRRKEVFSLHCGPMGASMGEVLDRNFMIIDEDTKKFHTARTVPSMVLISSDVIDGKLIVRVPSGDQAVVDIEKVIKDNIVHRTTLHAKLEADGLDCGDEVAELLVRHTGVSGMRLVMYKDGLYNGRPCISDPEWWNNPVPKRKDTVAYPDLAPFLITTEGSLHALNEQLENKVQSENFRANIVVDKCAAWDEDKWLDVKIGDVQLQCFKPCTRCVLTTVDPETGVKDPNVQPLRKLREFRLAPEGKLRKAHGDSPIFGVNAGILQPGYVHVGQTVWVKYKPSAF